MASIEPGSPAAKRTSGTSGNSGNTARDANARVAGLQSYGLLYGSSAVMLELYAQIERVAATEATRSICA